MVLCDREVSRLVRRMLEHMVDTVLLRSVTIPRILEGSQKPFWFHSRDAVFETVGWWLRSLNPSQVFLRWAFGWATGCQSLWPWKDPSDLRSSSFATPTHKLVRKRADDWLDFNRASLIMAVLKSVQGSCKNQMPTPPNLLQVNWWALPLT